jgi:hypothetical protein
METASDINPGSWAEHQIKFLAAASGAVSGGSAEWPRELVLVIRVSTGARWNTP